MITVELSYRMVPWLPFKKYVKASHPEGWAELDTFQFADVVEFINKPYDKNSHTALINSLLDLKDPLTDFPEEIIKLHAFIKDSYPIRAWVIKSLAVKNQILLGPSDEFRNVTIGEFIFGDTYFLEYVKTNSPESLGRFLSCFYRPVDAKGENNYTYEDNRVKFNPRHTVEWVKEFDVIDEGIKNAIAFNYKNIRGWIQDKYSWVFPKGSDSAPKSKPEGQWRNFAKAVIAGDYVNQEKRMETLMHTILYDMNQDIKDAERRKRNLKKK